jgi:hypothetical protein
MLRARRDAKREERARGRGAKREADSLSKINMKSRGQLE